VTLETAEELELVTRGRRSGKPHSVRAWFAHEDGALWLRTDSEAPDWLRNLKAEPRCEVLIGAVTLTAVYEPTPDRAAALKHVVTLWRAKYGPDWVQDWYFERGREPVKLRLVG
jgi:hypothetical protein